MSPSTEDVAVAVGRTARQLPNLAVVTTPQRESGPAWLVDSTTDTVYIAGGHPCHWAANVVDALNDLCAQKGLRGPAAPVKPTLTLLQGGAEEPEPEHARTGTDHPR